jgi:hypothetical protein
MQINHHSWKERTKMRKNCKVWLRNVVKCEEKKALQSLQILYTFVLRAEIAAVFGANVVAISARNTKVYKI